MTPRSFLAIAALIAFVGCNSTPDDPGKYQPEAPGPELQAKKRRYFSIKSRFVQKQIRSTASLNDIVSQPDGFKNVVVPRVPLTWLKIVEWDRVGDGITPEGSQDAQVSVASSINPTVTARVAISAFEWDAHRQVLEALDNTNIEATLFIPEESADDCVGRILDLNVLEGEYRGGKREGPWVVKDSYGRVRERGSYQDGKRVGPWTFFWPDGSKYREGRFVDGVEDGAWKNYFNNGQLSKEGAFDKGEQVGAWTFYYRNGDVERSMTYKDGLLTGPWKRYYRGNAVREEGSYARGTKTGTWTFYHSSGTKTEEGDYLEDLKDGPWTTYDLDGVAIERAVWSDGDLLRTKKLN